MTVRVRRHAARRLGVAIGMFLLLVSLAPAAPVEAATDRLPDLRSASITDLRIVKTSSGRRLLRFTSMMWNRGAGPFEVRANRASTSKPWKVDQIVWNSDGGYRRIRTGARLRFAGDGHDHWHVRRMMSYHLWGSGGTFRDAKIGFCFFDTNLVRGSLPRSPSRAKYRESTCGGRKALSTRTGISVGWGDRYPWNFAYQWIDITGLPGGTYTIRSAVDIDDAFAEEREGNNCSWARVRFGSTGKTVRVLDSGFGCIDDWSTTPYAEAIRWALDGILSGGCDPGMFCTNNDLTRGVTAALLARSLELPAATQDWFDDDDGTTFERDINRLAEAGFTTGCGPRRYCPARVVTRETAARFLDAAFDTPPTEDDFFTDDETSTAEDAINRLTAAGILSGCADDRYCPKSDISRGAFVQFLYRAVTSTAPDP